MNLREAVTGFLHDSPFIQEALDDGLINITSLARYMQPHVNDKMGKEISQSAIVMAIRRMEPSPYYKINKGIQKYLGGLGDVIVRTGLNSLTYENSKALISCEKELLERAQDMKDAFCSFSSGISETTLLISDGLMPHIREIFQHEKRTAMTESLCSITIRLPEDNTEVSGIYYFILKQIAWKGININEVISTTNEFTVVVKSKDLDQAFIVVHGLKNIQHG